MEGTTIGGKKRVSTNHVPKISTMVSIWSILWFMVIHILIRNLTADHGGIKFIQHLIKCIQLRLGIQGGFIISVSYTHLDVYKRQVHMHSVARLFINGFRHKGGCPSILDSRVVDHVLDDHGLIRHVYHIAQLHLDFHLS